MPISLNGIPINIETFPDGESKINIEDVFSDIYHDSETIYEVFKIRATIYDSKEIIDLCLIVDAIRRFAKTIGAIYGEELHLLYIPYSRQDRVCSRGEPFSIKVICDIINSFNFKRVCIYDPHSDVLTALLNNSIVFSIVDIFNTLSEEFIRDIDYIISPDAGAEKKVRALCKSIDKKMICAYKVRDVKTGIISDTHVISKYDIDKNKNYLIVDDLCDGGRTFVELAKVLDLPKTNLSLYVTHGLFTQGLDELKKYFNNIYCIHTKLDSYDESFLKLITPFHLLPLPPTDNW